MGRNLLTLPLGGHAAKMRTSVLRDFFSGNASASDLAEDLEGSRVQAGHDTVHHQMMDDLSAEFAVSPDHLVRLCDAVLAADLQPDHLATIGFGMIASDYFEWDADSPLGGRVADTLFDWSAPEVNYALRPETVRKFRHRLQTGEDTFTKADLEDRPPAGGRVVWNNPRSR